MLKFTCEEHSHLPTPPKYLQNKLLEINKAIITVWRITSLLRCMCMVCIYRIHTLTIRSCVPSGEMMVPLSPTSDGRVWDIQLVTIAMVLSTAPIFSMGTLILTRTHSHTQRTHKQKTLTCSHTRSTTVDSSHATNTMTLQVKRVHAQDFSDLQSKVTVLW